MTAGIWLQIIATLLAVGSATIAMTSMMATLRERVATHDAKLRFHSEEIQRIDREAAAAREQFAEVKGILSGMRDTLDDIQNRICK